MDFVITNSDLCVVCSHDLVNRGNFHDRSGSLSQLSFTLVVVALEYYVNRLWVCDMCLLMFGLSKRDLSDVCLVLPSEPPCLVWMNG